MNTIVKKIAQVLENNRKTLVLRNRYRETYRELSMLSDKDLADIGISRSMIEQIAFDHTYTSR